MPATPVDSSQVANDQGALNYKIFTDVPLSAANLTIQNAVAGQQRVNDTANAVHANTLNAAQQIAQNAGIAAQQIAANTAILAQAMMGRVGRTILDLSAEQAVAFDKEIAADVASKMQDFGATLSSIEQYAKMANNTPRETGLPIEESMTRINAALEAILQRLQKAP